MQDGRFGIVIDTNIWDNAFLGDNGEKLKGDCKKVILKFTSDNQLVMVVDSPLPGNVGSRILKEYRHHLGGRPDFERILIGFYDNRKLIQVPPVMDDNLKKELLRRGFHEVEDHIFVFTALAADKMIVTEDSDYGVHGEIEKEAVYDYMTIDKGMTLKNSEEFLQCEAL